VRRRAAALLAGLVIASACGKKGDPLPPLSTRPARTTDLAAEQASETAEVSFTFPSQRVDGEPLRDVDRIEIYRMENPSPGLTAPARGTGARSDRAPISGERRRAEAVRRREQAILDSSLRIATIGSDLLPSSTRGGRIVYRDSLAGVLASTPAPSLGYGVVTVRRNGERSEISNIATLTPVLPPAAPEGVIAQAEEGRICVRWEPVTTNAAGAPAETGGYFVYRRALGDEEYAKPLNADPVSAPEYADGSASYGSTYVYTVTAIPKGHAGTESAPAIQFGLEYADVYPPPAVPRLDALPEQSVVRLSWPPVDAPDLAGYVLFRAEGDGPLVRIADLPSTALAYEDRRIATGRAYRYVVRAADRAGNLSAPSPEATARPYREE
jgi:hypothetical protein